MPISLSACLVINNEEKRLRHCLASIQWVADEIIVVDTGSTDNSVAIASEFTNQIYIYQWDDNFSSARNFALSQASGEWVLVLDGDEELNVTSLNTLAGKLQAVDVEAYLVGVNHHRSGIQELLGVSDLQPRLFKNNQIYRYQGAIHEQILGSILKHNPAARIEPAWDIVIDHCGFLEEENGRLGRNTDLVERVFPPEEPLKHLYLGREYYRHHRFAEALEHFRLLYEQADSRSSYFPELVCSMGVSLYMLGREREALALINDALEVLPETGDLYYLQAIFLKNASRYAEAYQAFTRCLKTNQTPDLSGIYCRFQYKIYYYLGGLAEYFMDKDTALFCYFEALKRNPHMLDALRRMIVILNPRTYPEYTMQSLNRIFDLSDPGLQADMAMMFYEIGAYELALVCVKNVAKQRPISENIRLLQGLCRLRTRHYTEAEEELSAINSNKALYIEARKYLLIYYWLLREHRKAAGCLRRLKNAGAAPSTLHVLTLLTGRNATKTDVVPEQAYKAAKEVLDLLVELGDSWQVDEAFQRLTPVLGERPSYLLAELFYKYKAYDLAEQEFRRLMENRPLDGLAFYYLGKIGWIRGDLYAAQQYLRQAIDNGMDTPKARRESARLHQELAVRIIKDGVSQFPAELDLMNTIRELEDHLLEI